MNEIPEVNLADINGSALGQATGAITSEFRQGILQTPHAPKGSLFEGEVINTQGMSFDASAACSALNAIACLGRKPQASPETLLAELSGFMMKEKNGRYFPNVFGIAYLLTMAEKAENQQRLAISVSPVSNMGLAHDYLAHGYTAVAVDEPTSQTLTIGGMQQINGQAEWFVVPSNSQMEEVIGGLSHGKLSLPNQDVNAYRVNPRSLISRVGIPIWVVGQQR